jgi:hypothetical protein
LIGIVLVVLALPGNKEEVASRLECDTNVKAIGTSSYGSLWAFGI